MRHVILFLILASVASANPKYLAVRINEAGVVLNARPTNDPVAPDGRVIVPWRELHDQPGKPSKYRVVDGQIDIRPSSDVAADEKAATFKKLREELRALKREKREMAQALADGDADQSEVDELTAKIQAKRAEMESVK
jgi:hypothetical protein